MSGGSLISVLMGVYYQSPDTGRLARSVNSILSQTHENLELLICDDGSSPDAVRLLDRLAREDERIRLIRRGDMVSLPVKLNACLNEAAAQWIARMDDDDYAHPLRLEKQLNYLNTHPDTAFVGCNVNLIKEGEPVGQRRFPERPGVQDFYMTQPFIHPTLMFRRSALDAVGGYCEDPSVLFCEDYDLLLRMYAKGLPGANLQEILFDYTIPPTAKGKRKMKHRWNEAVTRWRRFRKLGCLPQALPWVVKPLAVGFLPEWVLSRVKKKTQDR